MEDHQSYSLLLSLLIVPIFLIAWSLISPFFYKKNPSSYRLPPGDVGWPVIGESLEFISTGKMGCPEKFINDRMKKNSSDVFRTSIVGEKMAVLCGPSGNKLLFSNENRLVKAWWPPAIKKILSTKKVNTVSESKMTRSLLIEILKPEALRNCIPIMDCMTKQHFEKEWLPHSQVKVYPLVKKLMFSLACHLFMSIEEPGHVAKLANHFSKVTAGLLSLPLNLPGTAFNCAIKSANLIRAELYPVIKRRRSQLSEGIRESDTKSDLLSKFLLATDEDGKFMSEVEIADDILGLLVAGHDTTSTVITFVVYYLADHPQIYARVLREQMEIAKDKGANELLNWEDIQKMKYSRNVANEVMRLAPPSAGSFREAISDFTYAGFSIPSGWKTFWSVHTTHKNQEYFPDPEKFDPSRFEGDGPAPYTFVPFGGGPRMCPGSEFARMEVLVFMHNLVRKFKWEKLLPNEKIIYAPMPMPVNNLPVKLLTHVN